MNTTYTYTQLTFAFTVAHTDGSTTVVQGCSGQPQQKFRFLEFYDTDGDLIIAICVDTIAHYAALQATKVEKPRISPGFTKQDKF
jgi:hypothetical protein